MAGLSEQGGCSVDWSWLAGQRVVSIENGLDVVVIKFESGLTWTIQARLWKGAPFLSFQPHRRPQLEDWFSAPRPGGA